MRKRKPTIFLNFGGSVGDACLARSTEKRHAIA